MLAGDKFICPVPHCSFARSSKPLVTTHFYQTHFKRFKCKKCGVKASSESRLAEHIENHLGVKGRTKDRIVCEVCSKSMTRTSFTRSGHQLNFSLFFVKCCCFSWRTNYRPLNGEEIILFFPSRNSLVSVSDLWRAIRWPFVHQEPETQWCIPNFRDTWTQLGVLREVRSFLDTVKSFNLWL